jgi:hypothetical protein
MGKIQIMCNKRLIFSIFLASSCFIIQSPLYAGVYKWVDTDGQIHYSDQPESKNATRVTIRENETTEPRTISKTEEELAESDKKNTDLQTEVPGELIEVEPSKKEKRKLCNEAKGDLEAISGRGRMREINEKGEYNYLTEKQRQQRISVAQKKKRKYCR